MYHPRQRIMKYVVTNEDRMEFWAIVILLYCLGDCYEAYLFSLSEWISRLLTTCKTAGQSL